MLRQPWLHDLVPALRAPTQVWSAPSGQITGEGITGCSHADVRVLRVAVVTVGDALPVPVSHRIVAADDVVFTALLSEAGDPGVDPTVRVVRRRHVTADGVTETIELHSWAVARLSTVIGVEMAADLAPLDSLKGNRLRPDVVPTATADGIVWADPQIVATLAAPGATVGVDGTVVRLTWQVSVPPTGRTAVSWTLRAARTRPRQAPAADTAPLPRLQVGGADRRWAPVLQRSISDVDALRMSIAGAVDQDFAAAGAPWFLTLFGRDSLWTARMMLPLGTGLAGSTLRALAARQGRRHDAANGEAPGKILHEVRAQSFDLAESPGQAGPRSLPAVYYGSIDATPLWILTLHDAWRWGLAVEQVSALLPALDAALGWLLNSGDVDGDGFLEYVDEAGTGLANQGWKDSGDSIRQSDGSLADAPIALCEVQAYAYAAALAGADLLEAFARPGAERLRGWAEQLRGAFRRSFWVSDAVGPYPAIALDAGKRPVASLTSNIGHLLGTGLLAESESADVGRRLAAPDMFSGYGIRTMSSTATGYSPTGYHIGSVWPHDTAIAVAGMAAAGLPQAGVVADGLLEAIHAFDGRVPELFAGDARHTGPPLPYPAACRPQAWAAASAVLLLSSVLGLRPGAATLLCQPVQPWPFGEMTVRGLRVGALVFDVEVDAAGAATVSAGAR